MNERPVGTVESDGTTVLRTSKEDVMSGNQGVLGNQASSASSDEILRKAAQIIGAEEADIPCPIPQPFLDHIKGHEDVVQIPMALLPKLAHEIREKIHASVKVTGGHLASNLGVTELSIALHRVFDFRKDRLIMDVGHQVYPHKMLTGRAGRFHTLRQADGLAGFPDHREDPVYDLFHTSHAGMATSMTLGMAIAEHRRGLKNHHIALVGDGAMTCGATFEALNHGGHIHEDMLVIFNDNGCSISANVGALSSTCSKIRKTGIFKRAKDFGREVLEKMPYGKNAERIAEQMLGVASHLTHSPGAIFMDLGFRYYGPVDGHDFESLHEWLEEMKSIKGPKLLHVVTHKGRGLQWAEEDPINWHGAKPYEVQNGTAVIKKSSKPAPVDYCNVVSDTILKRAKADKNIVAITAAMAEGTTLSKVRSELPDQFIDVGICEQHATALAAAMRKGGVNAVACIYSSFLQRAVDQLFHEVSLQDGIPITICMDRAGLCGDDGATANGVFDLAYMRAFPHFVLMAPKDGVETEAMVNWAIDSDKPCFIRTPKEPSALAMTKEFKPLELGKGEIVRQGEGQVAFLAYGAMVVRCMQAAEKLEKEHGIKATVANARFCKPLDTELVAQLLDGHQQVFTAEDHQLQNGFGTAVLEACNDLSLDTRKITRLGIPDLYVYHGKRDWQLAQVGLDCDGIVASVLKKVKK
ncbi:MAG: 1-deoxy-D-xylulose-5-phosphate synthase [Planctomycetes bacterium]|nr:1-deoxy-D-xylulose-5-phosphate synthase [Planctomycetota bacterium]